MGSLETVKIQAQLSPPKKYRYRLKRITTCGHPDRPHKAKGMCAECYHKEKSHEHFLRNREAIQQRANEWKRRNRKKIRRSQRKWDKANRGPDGKATLSDQRYKQSHPEKVKELKAQWYDRHKEEINKRRRERRRKLREERQPKVVESVVLVRIPRIAAIIEEVKT